MNTRFIYPLTKVPCVNLWPKLQLCMFCMRSLIEMRHYVQPGQVKMGLTWRPSIINHWWVQEDSQRQFSTCLSFGMAPFFCPSQPVVCMLLWGWADCQIWALYRLQIFAWSIGQCTVAVAAPRVTSKHPWGFADLTLMLCRAELFSLSHACFTI